MLREGGGSTTTSTSPESVPTAAPRVETTTAPRTLDLSKFDVSKMGSDTPAIDMQRTEDYLRGPAKTPEKVTPPPVQPLQRGLETTAIAGASPTVEVQAKINPYQRAEAATKSMQQMAQSERGVVAQSIVKFADKLDARLKDFNARAEKRMQAVGDYYMQNSVVMQKTAKFLDNVDGLVDRARSARAARQEAMRQYAARDPRFKMPNQLPASEYSRVDDLLVKKPPVQAGAERVATAPENQAEQKEAPRSFVDRIQDVYDNILSNEGMRAQLDSMNAFAEKHGLTPEESSQMLVAKFGKETAALLRLVQKNPGGKDFLEELKAFGLDPATTESMAVKYFSRVDKKPAAAGTAPEGSTAAPSGTTLEKNAATPAGTESAQSAKGETASATEKAKPEATPAAPAERTLSEGEKAEARKAELRELMKNASGSLLTTSEPTRQMRAFGQQLEVLKDLSQRTPPQKLPSRFSRRDQIFDRSGSAVTENANFTYDGPGADSEGALGTAMKDLDLKMEFGKQLAEAMQDKDEADVFKGFAKRMGEAVGDQNAIVVDVGTDREGNKLTQFVPGETQITASYEDGKLTLKVEQLTEGMKIARAANEIESKLNLKQ